MSDYTPTPDQPAPAGPKTSTMAIISLIVGILGLVTSWTGLAAILSLAAVITGHISKKEIKNGAGTVKGNGLATGGLITGYIGLAFGLCICLLFALSFFGLFTIPYIDMSSYGY
jgi:hypothetical protein